MPAPVAEHLGHLEASVAPRLGGRRAWGVWALSVAFVIYYFSFQTGYAIVNSRIQKELGLTIAQIAAGAAVYTWVFAVFQFLSGPLLDRIGVRRVLLPAILLVTIGIFVFAAATDFTMLIAAQCCVAIGACAGFVGAGCVGGKWFGMARFSFMFGLVQFCTALFSAFNQNVLNWALSAMDWRSAFYLAGGLGIVLLILALLYLRDPEPTVGRVDDGLYSFALAVFRSLKTVAAIPHIWLASAFGALCFGTMLALGVIWAPKLLMARGLEENLANTASSFLWIGLAAGCFVLPWASDRLRSRKVPVLSGIALQAVSLILLFYYPTQSASLDMILCLLFGFGNAAHMLAFSTAADIVEPGLIGTSAAFVNGAMFVLGGIMISRPGVLVGIGLNAGKAPATLELAQFAGRPLIIGIFVALAIALLIRETYPKRGPGQSRGVIA